MKPRWTSTAQPSLRSTRVAVALLAMAAAIAAAPAATAGEPLRISGAEAVGGPVTPMIIDVDLRDLPRAREWQPGDPVKEVPRRFYPPTGGEVLEYQSNPDVLAEIQEGTPLRSGDGFTTAIINQPGLGFTGVSPPDPVGDVGPDHYIQSVNGFPSTVYQIYDKAGTVVAGPFALDDLGSVQCGNGAGDPIILYDRQADRWFMQEFSSGGNYLCVYISQTADPVAGGWYHYAFQAPSFPDYPHFGVWSDAYYATTNENDPALYAFDRTNMLAGTAARPMQRFTLPRLGGYGFQAATPADHDGALSAPAGSPGLIMRHVDEEAHSEYTNNGGTDLLEIFAFDGRRAGRGRLRE